MKHHINYIRKSLLIAQLAEKHYEQGNYAKSYYQVWRNFVYKVYPISYRRFLKCLDIAKKVKNGYYNNKYDEKQLKLF